MVKSTTIVRASDALPLAATVDDEQVRGVLLCLKRLDWHRNGANDIAPRLTDRE